MKTCDLFRVFAVMRRFGMLLVAAAVMNTVAEAQSDSSKEALSQTAANPVADLVSLPVQNNSDFGLGPNDRVRNVMNIQPVVPLASGRLVTRTILPIVWLPDLAAESGLAASGLGDITFTAFYVPESESMIWGVGPVVELPAGGEKRGTEKWSAGPSAVLLAQPAGWTLGLLANQLWSFAGDDGRAEVSKGLLQYFIVRQLGDGWYVNSAPIITVNWKADSGQRWIVPFGVGGGKLAFVGRLPVNVQVGGYWNAVKPDLGPDWQLRLQVQALFPVPGGG